MLVGDADRIRPARAAVRHHSGRDDESRDEFERPSSGDGEAPPSPVLDGAPPLTLTPTDYQ